MTGAKHCSACGAAATGTFCSQCGVRLDSAGGCGGCGTPISPGAAYCGECGRAVAPRASKPASARLPWILSAAVLIGFSVLLAQLVQRGSVQRTGDMTATGGLPVTPSAPGSAGMPSLEELSAMTPRQAADRLFERAMSEHEGGSYERASFFLDMGLQAYAAVPPSDIDADASFHMGLMQLLQGDSIAARGSATAILDDEAEHLLGLILLARIADFTGDREAAAGSRDRVRAIVEAAGGIPDRLEYQSHRALIERELDEAP